MARLHLSPNAGGNVIRAGAGLLADLVFPRRCGLCGSYGTFLCAGCAEELPRALGPRCRTCAAPHPGAGCHACRSLAEQPLDSLTAVFRFDGGARRLVHRLKYDRLSALAEPMGRLMAAALSTDGEGRKLLVQPDVIAPVPLHPRRRRDRGFNQAELLARGIGAASGVAVAGNMLARVRATAPQVRQAGVAARAANIAGAFACRGTVKGQRVLLVDDVSTTGATLRTCAAALQAAGAAAVHAAVFAHED